MNTPIISIVIPAYNASKTLMHTCNSIANQKYTHWECIIVDDGSTDETKEVALNFVCADTRFQYIYQNNQGVSAARNNGIQSARGSLLAFLDADDLWLPNALNTFVASFNKQPDLDLAWGLAERFTEDGQIKPIAWKNYHTTGVPWYDMLVHDFMPIGSFCMCRNALPSPPYFDTTITHGEDRDFLLRVLKGATTSATTETILLIRQHTNSVSTQARQSLESELRCMQKHLQDADIPATIRKRAKSALAFRCAVIACFVGRDWYNGLRWYLRAVRYDPFNYNNYWLILRKIKMAICPPASRHVSSIYGDFNE